MRVGCGRDERGERGKRRSYCEGREERDDKNETRTGVTMKGFSQ